MARAGEAVVLIDGAQGWEKVGKQNFKNCI